MGNAVGNPLGGFGAEPWELLSRTPIPTGGLVPKLGLDNCHYSLYNHIVVEPVGYEMTSSDSLDATFAALADPTRRAILARLASGEASVLELAEPFSMTQPAVSKHLKVLERAGLISHSRDAQRRPRRLEAKPLAEATEWLERYRDIWAANFQRLDALLEQMKTHELKAKEKKTHTQNDKGDQ
jgi:DNA-binding transcriptional ArsR family regulator